MTPMSERVISSTTRASRSAGEDEDGSPPAAGCGAEAEVSIIGVRCEFEQLFGVCCPGVDGAGGGEVAHERRSCTATASSPVSVSRWITPWDPGGSGSEMPAAGAWERVHDSGNDVGGAAKFAQVSALVQPRTKTGALQTARELRSCGCCSAEHCARPLLWLSRCPPQPRSSSFKNSTVTTSTHNTKIPQLTWLDSISTLLRHNPPRRPIIMRQIVKTGKPFPAWVNCWTAYRIRTNPARKVP